MGLLAVGVLGSAVLMGGSAQAAVTSINPFATNGGFTLVSLGSMRLANSEILGSVAALGPISSGKDRFPVIHNAGGMSDYTVPVVDGRPVRILAQRFEGTGGFDVSNRDDSGSLNPGSNEAIATVKFVNTAGLTGGARSGGVGPADGRDFLRVTNPEGGYIDLKAVPFAGHDLASLRTDRPSVEDYLPDLRAGIARTNQCLAQLHTTDQASVNRVTLSQENGLVFASGFSTDRPNIINLSDIAGRTVKMDRAGGYAPTAQAPLIIQAAPGTTQGTAAPVGDRLG